MPDTDSIIDRARWDEKHRNAEFLGEPSSFLVRSRPDLRPGRVLDVACGLGASALYLAGEGFTVEALDWSVEALRKLDAAARARGLAVAPVACDVSRFPVPRGRYSVVCSFRFLDRKLWPAMIEALAPGGALILSTFTERTRLHRPDFPLEYCLGAGELPEWFSGRLRVHRYEEPEDSDQASILAFR